MDHLIRFHLKNKVLDNADESLFESKDNRVLAFKKATFLLQKFYGQGAEQDPINFKLKECKPIYSVHPFQIEEAPVLQETIEPSDILTNTDLKEASIVISIRELLSFLYKSIFLRI